MSDEPDSLVLRCRRRIDARLERIKHRLDELTGRAGILEQQYAGLSRRLDNVEMRLERMARRLDLTGAPG